MQRKGIFTILANLCLLITPTYCWSEERPLEVIFITSERMQASEFDTPFSVAQISAEDLRNNLYRSLPEMLKFSNGVMVQKTAYGQGSPYIRGFTGFRTLFLFDGIRLNNSTFREGPNQYWNTVDPFSIDKLEIVKGPTSSLYGADAIGGTVQALSPDLSTGQQIRNTELNYFYRGATAEHSQLIHASVISEGLNSAFQIGGTYKDFGDLTRGNNKLQPNTGYQEYNLDAKFEMDINQRWDLTYAAYLTQQDDVPRTHRTIYSTSFAGTSLGSELRRDLTHKRILSYFKLNGKSLNGSISEATFTLSFQQQKEHRTRLRTRDSFDLQGVRTNTIGLQAHLFSEFGNTNFAYGIEGYLDNVDSYSSNNEIQGPVADDASYNWLGAYVQARLSLAPKWDLLTGVRINYMRASADKISVPNSADPKTLTDSWNDTVANITVNYRLNQAQNLYAAIAQGFRAPNLSDLTRFDTARSNEFEIPSTDLDSEHFTNLSLGYKYHKTHLLIDWSVFYTLINNQIERIPTGNQNADGEFEISKENIGDGYFAGSELGAKYSPNKQWSFSAQLAYLTGKSDTFATSERIKTREYASRLMPATFQSELHYSAPHSPLWVGLNITAAKRADRLSPRDKLDSGRIPPGGTPGYTTINARLGYEFNQQLNLTLVMENLFDKDYRIHGSGQNEAGRNFILALSGNLQ